ncbi:MAG TPA: hypothetical protein DDZ51_08390 [Planctomycetaceae bacterium]|nr:hypothetical protein [Planctomycetaceae bacterium]
MRCLDKRFGRHFRLSDLTTVNRRRLVIERLDKRELLAADINSISGTVYNDLTGNGLTADDQRFSGVDVRLYRDGGDTVFSTDDIAIETQTTNGSGTYLFGNLEPGLYFLEQLTTPLGVVVPEPIAITILSNITAVIDRFDQTSSTLAASPGLPSNTSNLPAIEAIGGRRKIELTYGGGPSSVTAQVDALNERFALNSDNATFGSTTIRYDGDAFGILLNPNGLGGINLSAGDLNSGLTLELFRNIFVAAQTYTIRVYTDANNFSEIDRPFDSLAINSSYLDFIPFTEFFTGSNATGPANFANVGAVELVFANEADQNIRASAFEAIAPRSLTFDLRNLNTDLSITKTVQTTTGNPIPPATVQSGQTIVYRLVAANAGPGNATGVRVVDILPPDVTFVSATINGGAVNAGIVHNAGTVTATIGNLANSDQAVVLITATVNSSSAALVTNQALVSNTPNTDPNLANNESELSTSVVRAVDLAVTASVVAGTNAAFGGTVTYEVTVTNLPTSPGDARGFTVTNILPAGLTFVPGSFNANGTAVMLNAVGQNLTFSGVPLNIGQSVTVRFDAAIGQNAPVTLFNTANVTPFNNTTIADVDLVPANNQDSETINPTRQIDLVVTKDDGIATGAFATPGLPITYTITVTNTGISDAVNVNVVDMLPAGVVATAIMVNGNLVVDNNSDAGILSFVLPSVPTGVSNAVTALVTANIGAAVTGAITNSVTIQGGGVGDPIAGNTSTATTNLQPQVDASITMTGPATAIPGGAPITYTLQVTNNGPSVATNALVSGFLPAGLTIQSITLGGTAVNNTGSGNNVQFTIPQLLVGTANALTYTLTASIAASATSGLSNTVTVTAAGDTNPANNTSSTLTNLTPIADMGVTKSVSAANAQPGDQLTYTIVVTNNGPSVARGVTLTDLLPAGTTFISGTGPGGTSLTANGQTVDVAIGTLNPLIPGVNDPAQYTIVAAVNTAFEGVLTNLVTVATTTGEGTNDRPNVATANTVVSPPVSGNIQGHVFCDRNGNGLEDIQEEVSGALVFIDSNGNRLLDSALGEPSTSTDLNGNYALPASGLGPPANVVVVTPSGCFPNTPDIGVTRTTITTGLLSRDVAVLRNPTTGVDDLLVINELGNDLVRLVNDGAGNFSVQTPTMLGKRPYAISVYQPIGQVATIAVAAIGSGVSDRGALYVIRDNLVQELAAGDGPIDVVVNDFNGDGQPDFVTASFRDGKILARMSGEPELRELAVGRVPRSITTADINGDSLLDLVVVTSGFDNETTGEAILLLGDGTGGFEPLRNPIARGGATAVAVAPYDGLPGDELLVAHLSGTVDIYAIDSENGAITLLHSVAADPGITAIVGEDLNEDGFLDLVVANPASETINIFIGQPDRSFANRRTIRGVVTPAAMATGNFDNDSILDIAVANLFGSSAPYRLPSTVSVLGLTVAEREVTISPVATTTTDFGLGPFGRVPIQSAPISAARHDVNGDGDITPLDALLVINDVSEQKQIAAEGEERRSTQFRAKTDVNGDGWTTPLDALIIITWLSQRTLAAGPSLDAADLNRQRIETIDQMMGQSSLLF